MRRRSKRKASSPPSQDPSQTLPQAKRPRQEETNHSPFLGLPRELRDEIYRHIVEADTSSPTLKSQNQNLVTKCGLVGVSNQICSEFLDAVLFHAPVITTTVRNHNFSHVVTFLNRLSEAQFKKFEQDAEVLLAKDQASRNQPRGFYGFLTGRYYPYEPPAAPEESSKSEPKKRIIKIILTYTNTKTSTKAQLNRWLDRFDDPKRRGAEVEFEYVIDRATWGNGGYKQRPRYRTTMGKRSIMEARKIEQAERI